MIAAAVASTSAMQVLQPSSLDGIALSPNQLKPTLYRNV